MKCPRCGAETSRQRYCIYCGERLSSSSAIRVQRAPSGVMRIRYRGNISQTELPEVRKRSSEPKEMKLASLSSSQNIGKVSRQDDEIAMEVTEMKENQESSARESRELQAMLSRLSSNAAKSVQRSPVDMPVKPVKSAKSDVDVESSESDSDRDNSLSGIDLNPSSLDDLNLNLCNDDDFDDLDGESYEDHESFFEIDTSEQDVSGTIPMPSGTFAKTPSGGFHLIFDGIKSACKGMVARVKSLTGSKSSSNVEPKSGRFDDSVNRQKQIKFLTLGAILVAIVIIVVAVATSGEKAEPETEIAAQAVPTTEKAEEFGVLALDGTDEDFADLDFTDESLNVDAEDEEVVAPSAQQAAADLPKSKPAGGSSRLTEARLYEHKDNVLAVVTEGETYKTKRSCIIRKGPASRFELAKQVGAGVKIQILATVEEDWVLESGSVWKKAGHTDRLGPGDQFAEARKGMKVSQPKGRVISAKNWKYVKAGDVYGYVGPACFK